MPMSLVPADLVAFVPTTEVKITEYPAGAGRTGRKRCFLEFVFPETRLAAPVGVCAAFRGGAAAAFPLLSDPVLDGR
jgi:hypothetical protein